MNSFRTSPEDIFVVHFPDLVFFKVQVFWEGQKIKNIALEASKLGQIPYEFVEDIAWGYFYCAFSRSGLVFVKVELFWEGQKNSEQSLMLLNGIQDKNIVAYF